MENTKFEIRSIQLNVEFNEDSRIIEGYAVVFNTPSVLIYEENKLFHEYILPEALTQEQIDSWDIFALVDHEPKRGYLGRSRQGQGSLELTVDEHGLKFRFEAPNTALGDEIIEYIKRGDVYGCSFNYQIYKGTDKWQRGEDGVLNRYITSICNINEISIVGRPAYQDTEVALRSMNEYIESNNMEETKIEETVVEVQVEEETKNEEVKETPVNEETPNTEETQNEEQENETRSDDKEEVKEDADKTTDTPEDESEHDPEQKEQQRQINTNSRMEKFNLLRAINAQISGKAFNEADAEVINLGRSQMGELLENTNSIVLPSYNRADILATAQGQGQEFVPTETGNIVMPLRNKLVAVKAGATFLNLTGNLTIPTYSGSTVGWEGEVGAPTSDGAGTFGDVKLTPHRLTAYVDVSKLALIQANEDVEALLISDIYDALTEKLESTIFGDQNIANAPMGLLVGASPVSLDWTQIVSDEAAMEGNNYGSGDYKYVVAPSAKAKFKTTTVSGSKSDLRMIQVGNEANGYEVISSNAVATNGVLFGAWKELLIAQFGGIELTVDPLSQAHNGKVRIVVNGYFDAQLRRANALVKYTV